MASSKTKLHTITICLLSRSCCNLLSWCCFSTYTSPPIKNKNILKEKKTQNFLQEQKYAMELKSESNEPKDISIFLPSLKPVLNLRGTWRRYLYTPVMEMFSSSN
ncbi:hypothetical protein V6Z11_A13G125100 [Gossypium hirsutum]